MQILDPRIIYDFSAWERRKHQPYDYAKKGLLNKILPEVITSTTNPTTARMLDFVEYSLVFLMKYVDVLKNFKDYNWGRHQL